MSSSSESSAKRPCNNVEDEQTSIPNIDEYEVKATSSSTTPPTSLASSSSTTPRREVLAQPDITETPDSPGCCERNCASQPEDDDHDDSESTNETEEEPLTFVMIPHPSDVDEVDDAADDEYEETLVDQPIGGEEVGHRRLSVVDFSYEDLSTPELSAADDGDTSSENVSSAESDEEDGPLAIQHTGDGAFPVAIVGVTEAMTQSSRKRSRAALEDDDDNHNAPNSGNAYQESETEPEDAPRPVKRARYTGIPTDDAKRRTSASRPLPPDSDASQASAGSTAHDLSANAAGEENIEKENKAGEKTEGRGYEGSRRKKEVEGAVRSVAEVHTRDITHQERSESITEDHANDEI